MEDTSVQNNSATNSLMDLLPLLALTALVGATIALGVFYFAFKPSMQSANQAGFVSFDIVKLVNAQRAVASALLKEDPSAKAESTTLLLDVSKNTKAAIEKMANGRIVLVKQSIVAGNVDDITDDVLNELKLPTDVPTTNLSENALNEMPIYIQPLQVAPRARTALPEPSRTNLIP